jgi:tRNA1Val (adenine37-N6)-methyltransferase
MRVNTDGVLLGAWADVSDADRILDVGTGTGVIALMLAQRSPYAHIDAVEIDVLSAADARNNVALSPWANRIDVINCSFQDFAHSVKQSYNLIVSNPPYFNQSLKSPHTSRNLSRHSDALPYTHLIDGVINLLAPSGRFCGFFPIPKGMYSLPRLVYMGFTAPKKLTCYPTQAKGF